MDHSSRPKLALGRSFSFDASEEKKHDSELDSIYESALWPYQRVYNILAKDVSMICAKLKIGSTLYDLSSFTPKECKICTPHIYINILMEATAFLLPKLKSLNFQYFIPKEVPKIKCGDEQHMMVLIMEHDPELHNMLYKEATDDDIIYPTDNIMLPINIADGMWLETKRYFLEHMYIFDYRYKPPFKLKYFDQNKLKMIRRA